MILYKNDDELSRKGAIAWPQAILTIFLFFNSSYLYIYLFQTTIYSSYSKETCLYNLLAISLLCVMLLTLMYITEKTDKNNLKVNYATLTCIKKVTNKTNTETLGILIFWNLNSRDVVKNRFLIYRGLVHFEWLLYILLWSN